MRIAFRVDASVQVGIGHVMRTLTLANELLKHSVESHFICRFLPEQLHSLMLNCGHTVHLFDETKQLTAESPLSQKEDALETAKILSQGTWSWVVVDKYDLDHVWEIRVASYCEKIMVIDDLADRFHACDVLLDQTLTRSSKEYRDLVPDKCILLLGPKYALLRPEFQKYRKYSLKRRRSPRVREVLISLGGTDPRNVTDTILNLLIQEELISDINVTIVLGSSSPCLNSLKSQIDGMTNQIQLLVDVEDIAKLMIDSDLVIGAAGTTSWERCCLGIPTLMVVVADNQRLIANALNDAGAAICLGDPLAETFQRRFLEGFSKLSSPENLVAMSKKASNITDGRGAQLLAEHILRMA